MSADSPELAAAKQLLDAAKDQGFRFQRIAPGPDGSLRGIRQTPEFLDELYVAGFWTPDSCTAIRRRRCALIVPGGLPVTARVVGDALSVLHTVVTDWRARHDHSTRRRQHLAALVCAHHWLPRPPLRGADQGWQGGGAVRVSFTPNLTWSSPDHDGCGHRPTRRDAVRPA